MELASDRGGGDRCKVDQIFGNFLFGGGGDFFFGGSGDFFFGDSACSDFFSGDGVGIGGNFSVVVAMTVMKELSYCT